MSDKIDIEKLNIGEKIPTRKIYVSQEFIDILGEELIVVGKTVSFVGSNEVMTEIKRWKHDFNPDDYRHDD